MTRKLSVLLLPLVLLVFVATVNAQNATSGSAQATTDSVSNPKRQINNVLQVKNNMKATVQAKRDEFKTRIQTIKDQKKKALIERIDAKIERINKKQTSRFSEVLTMLQRFLDKIKQSATDANVLADVAAAQTAIDAAKTAVDVQADKTYTMEITDDTALRSNAGATVSQLRQNLTAVHKLVVDAKQAVQKLNTDRKIIKKATSSANL